MSTKEFTQTIDTPLGLMCVTANTTHVRSIHFVDQQGEAHSNAITREACRQLTQYFTGDRTTFDLPLAAEGTEFQQNVWQALISVDYGDTASYADIAKKIGNTKAVRAVGTANGRNPMTIVVPCHRIIGSDGSLTGYASGVERKAWLLRHESGSELALSA